MKRVVQAACSLSIAVALAGEVAPPEACSACEDVIRHVRDTPKLFQRLVEEPLAKIIAQPICDKIKAAGNCDPTKHTLDPHFRPCDDMCKGMMREYGDVIFNLIEDTTLNETQVCAAFGGVCKLPLPQPDVTAPPVRRSDLSNQGGEPVVPRWTDKRLRTRRFAHFSDVHAQADYKVGNEEDCGQAVCCRGVLGPARSAATAAGRYGSDNCDLPLDVLELMMDSARSHDPDFVLQTGDDPAHDLWQQSRSRNANATVVFSDGLSKRFSVPVANALGNHDVYPVNQYQGPGKDSWLYDAAADAWSSWLSEDAHFTMRFGAFYQIRLLPKLRALVLNSGAWAEGPGDNWYFTARRVELATQLAWARDVLDQARLRQEKVLWLMHHPEGSSYAPTVEHLWQEYNDVIAAAFVGHSHTSWFTATAPSGTAAGVVEYCTGGDIGFGLNPTYRVFEYEVDEDDNFVGIVDFEQYYMDFAAANADPRKAQFTKLYSAKDAFRLPDLQAASWRALAQSWLAKSGDYNETWSKYALYMTRAKLPVSQQDMAGEACKALHPFDEVYLKACKNTEVDARPHDVCGLWPDQTSQRRAGDRLLPAFPPLRAEVVV